MKLSGNKKDGRHVGKGTRMISASGKTDSPRGRDSAKKEYAEQAGGRRSAAEGRQNATPSKRRKAKNGLKVLTAVVFVFIALGVAVYAFYKTEFKPPEVIDEMWEVNSAPTDEAATDDPRPAPSRDKTKYTFLVLGTDDGNGNTDTIMVATFDATAHTLNVVNIPRDTLVNVPWYTRKANTLLANADWEPEGVIPYLADILGYKLDFYVVVDLEAFSALVDAIGGVDFDVPVNMDYEDPAQDLYIHLDKGPQHLDGAHALQLVRCRSVYSSADIGRIGTQQEFLKAAAEQILTNRNELNVTDLIKIFMNYVDTNLDLGSLGWLGNELLKMDSDKISLETIPANYNDSVNGNSYCTIYVNDWLEILNTKLNPFDKQVVASDLSILTRDANGKLYATNGVIAGKSSWGSGGSTSSSGGSSSSANDDPDPSPSVSQTSEPDPSPSDTVDASPSSSPVVTDPPPSNTGSASPSPQESAEPSTSTPPSAEPSPEVTDTPTDPPVVPSDWYLS
jgi:LCP family protein required for cell wall assembly